MDKKDIIRKLTSRKFWLALAGFVTSLIIATTKDAEIAETVSGIIMSGGCVIAYIFAEGWTDAASLPLKDWELPEGEDEDDNAERH